MQRVRLRWVFLAGLGPRRARAARVLPGFGLSLGVTLSYLALFVLIPLTALVARTFTLSWPRFVALATSPRAIASYQLTIGTSALAALDQCGLRAARCVGARALPLPGPPRHRRDRGSAIRAADRGGWHHAHLVLFDDGMAGPDSRGAGAFRSRSRRSASWSR